MTDYQQHQINVMISTALEKIQPLDPGLYGEWYSKLYPPYGDSSLWCVNTLRTLEQLFINRQ